MYCLVIIIYGRYRQVMTIIVASFESSWNTLSAHELINDAF